MELVKKFVEFLNQLEKDDRITSKEKKLFYNSLSIKESSFLSRLEEGISLLEYDNENLKIKLLQYSSLKGETCQEIQVFGKDIGDSKIKLIDGFTKDEWDTFLFNILLMKFD